RRHRAARVRGGRARAQGRPGTAAPGRPCRQPAGRGGPGRPSRLPAALSMSRPAWAEAYRAFRWEDSLRALDWTAEGPVDLGRTIVDRHAGSGRPALRWFGKDGSTRAVTFAELAALTGRFANALRALGVR